MHKLTIWPTHLLCLVMFCLISAPFSVARAQSETENTAALLHTGLGIGDTSGYWQCGHPSQATRFFLIWSDGSAILDRKHAKWEYSATSPNEGELSFSTDAAQTKFWLSNFQSIHQANDNYVATNSDGYGYQCILHGPSLIRGTFQLSDSTASDSLNGLHKLVRTESGDAVEWSCSLSSVESTRQLTLNFTTLSEGTIDGAQMKWYVDPSNTLYVNQNGTLSVFPNLFIDDSEADNVQLNLRYKNKIVHCTP